MNLTLKSINEILNNNFYIPSYQRGYKWDTQQVEDLLNDIYEFANQTRTNEEFYCLQPIVVLKEKLISYKISKNIQLQNFRKPYYKVIDGQQRFTTIYIILKYLKNLQKEFEEIKKECNKIEEFFSIEDFKIDNIYNIKYETRQKKDNNSKDFLENQLQNGLNYDNPDFYYMSNAYKAIKNWFKSKNKKLFLDTLLNNTKVIWYEVKPSTEKEEIDIFTRLNIGKIPLTNAELIKAMLLLDIHDYKEQIEFSTTWDKMELTLQNDEFWYFLSNKQKVTTTIDLIFEVLAENYKEEYNKNKSDDDKIKFNLSDDKFSFYVFDKVIKENKKSRNEIWKDTQKIYRYFIDWYNDREMYHKIGFLINFEIIKLLDLLKNYENKTKDEFKKFLKKEIKNSIKDINSLNELNYGDKYILKLLLLFNLETILQNTNLKFNFYNYKYVYDENKKELKKAQWDIEHIASQTDNDIENKDREKWLNSINEFYKEIKNIDELKKDNDEFKEFFNEIKKQLSIQETTNKNNIGNLTLLNSSINRSYGNAFFPIKRAIIIEEDSKGTFIPPATKNVFLKQYSKKISDMMNWTDDDIKSYREEIYELLKKYGVKNV